MTEAYALTTITPPPYEPISRAEAKRFLNIDDDITRDDLLVDGLIVAARNWCEGYTGRALIQQTLEMAVDVYNGRVIELPRSPVISIDSIKYTDSSGAEQTWASTNYQTDIASQPARVTIAYAGALPSSQRSDLNAWRLRFTAGYAVGSPNDQAGYAASVPEALKVAMKVVLAAFYANRENPVVPKAAEYIAGQYRVSWL